MGARESGIAIVLLVAYEEDHLQVVRTVLEVKLVLWGRRAKPEIQYNHVTPRYCINFNMVMLCSAN